MIIIDRLTRLRAEMKKRNIAIYIVPTADPHGSEYVGVHFKSREFITGFTGSAGTAVITMTEAGLWTDGRYFVQAAQQLQGTTIELRKMGQEGVPTIDEYLRQTLKEGEILGFDGKMVSGKRGESFEKIAQEKNGSLYVTEDLMDLIWEDRPEISKEPVRIFDMKYTGKDTSDKLADVRKTMVKKNADVHLISSLYDIAWLLNVRGGDILHVPVVLSFLSITRGTCTWYLQEELITEEIKRYLSQHEIQTKPYDSFYDDVKTIPTNQKVLMDRSVVNYRICNDIPTGVEVINAPDPSTQMKAIKNEVEQENTRQAHIKDAIAMIHFMYWLKTNVGKIPMTELSAADHLAHLRADQEGFLDLSFDTICGYADHGAIVHYSATPESDVELKPEGFLLVDSGGHYMEGTTDITRTFALGPITDEMKADFTRVFRAHTNLANARFLHGCTGFNLDILARAPFWEAGLDYNHGTGHGVGYVLNVHEGPNAFRWKQSPGRSEGTVLEEGMITTDEPGIYLEGKYGIRTENELICRKGEKNEYGQFMYFENITYVPIDLDAIAPEQLTSVERKHLNDYHAMVYEKMSPYFEGEEQEFLKKYTREV
ncbi:MAG: aminopeptidase P family protein [Lachnospiraceae bacterium]|nr:aminopeptidase P family protein [Lachnospiraceae bacterium]